MYLYTLSQDLIHDTGINPAYSYDVSTLYFSDNTGKTRLSISKNGLVRVFKDYSWDGCSPKIKLGDMLIGTPEGAVNSETGYVYTYSASCLHDALYQFIKHPYMPFSRQQIDKIFKNRLDADGFKYSKIYYVAVRLFGGLFS